MITESPAATQALAGEMIASLHPGKMATIVELVGDLGAGKTTFMQGVGAYFGITGALPSPTFVIGRAYNLPPGKPWKRLIHIDAYRIETAEELKGIDWDRYADDPGNIIFVEWPANMKTELAADKRITFNHIDETKREINI